MIQANPNENWYWESVSQNPNISWENIQDTPDKLWNWEHLGKNLMPTEKEGWLNQRRLKHIKAFQIQRYWRNCSCNPQYKLTQRLLLRLYHGIG